MKKEYYRKTIDRRDVNVLLIALTITSMFAIRYALQNMAAKANEIISPIPDNGAIATITKKEYIETEDFDFWVNKYAHKYLTNERDIEYTKYKVRCLYWKESRNSLDADQYGDNGKAGGPLQFHQPTWESYRKIMISEGFISEIGSRHNLEQAIETTIWAISDGRENAWGPITRGECK